MGCGCGGSTKKEVVGGKQTAPAPQGTQSEGYFWNGPKGRDKTPKPTAAKP